tara:strand:- start:13 stop:375 length:363 start_codon:yes stop_codon:yes gene_type:complete
MDSTKTTEEQNNAYSVMQGLEELAKERGVLDWHMWLTGATKLTALLQNEEDELAEMEHRLIKMKASLIEEGRPANQAKLLVESHPSFLEVMKKRAFIKRCDETIKIAKKFATISSDQAKY